MELISLVMEENWSMDKYFKEHKSIIEQISNYLKILKPAIFCIVALALGKVDSHLRNLRY